MKVSVYTDGGCQGNPGIGAWSFVIVDRDHDNILIAQSGFDAQTTNNRMELQAAIEALRSLRSITANIPVPLYTDSQYVQKGITVWIKAWMRNNWRSSNKKAIKNIDLWQCLYKEQQELVIEWHWLMGHSDNYYNNYCHNMVQKKLKTMK